MADIYDVVKRSALMGRVRGSGNKSTELKMCIIFRKSGIKGWRRHASLPGRPDFIFRKARLALFVDGCFWHKCPFHYKAPSSNSEFWRQKVDLNVARDIWVNQELSEMGWRVIRFWEHELKKIPAEGLAIRVRNLLEKQ